MDKSKIKVVALVDENDNSLDIFRVYINDTEVFGVTDLIVEVVVDSENRPVTYKNRILTKCTLEFFCDATMERKEVK